MYIKLHVVADSKKELLTKVSEDHFTATVREAAERNMANRRVVQLIAAHFAVPANKVRIISGHHSPGKILSVDIS
jgi:uncharacterized protein YggU (UPF0235/DUF167 family)